MLRVNNLSGFGGKAPSGGGGAIEFIYGNGAGVNNTAAIDTGAEGVSGTLSNSTSGDLVIVACSFDGTADADPAPLMGSGKTFTIISDRRGSTNPGGGVWYRFLDGTETDDVYIDDTSSGAVWWGLSVCVGIFRNVNSYLSSGTRATGTSGLPNPPSHTANGELWIASGHLDDDDAPMTAQTNYTIVNSSGATNGSNRSTTILSYRIASLTSDDPGAFGGAGTDAWFAETMAFD